MISKKILHQLHFASWSVYSKIFQLMLHQFGENTFLRCNFIKKRCTIILFDTSDVFWGDYQTYSGQIIISWYQSTIPSTCVMCLSYARNLVNICFLSQWVFFFVIFENFVILRFLGCHCWNYTTLFRLDRI